MPPAQITDRAEFDAALVATRFLLLKHSLVCPVSTRAFQQYERFCDAHPDVPTGWIDVIGQRPWSQEVETRTGLRHESPQAIWLRDGQAVWNASHFDVTAAALAGATTPDA
jgi:bacillithiol system protein YtxJ